MVINLGIRLVIWAHEEIHQDYEEVEEDKDGSTQGTEATKCCTIGLLPFICQTWRVSQLVSFP